MKKRLFIASLVLAILVAIVPSVAMAAPPEQFAANGQILYISHGTVSAAGQSERWVVQERELAGIVSGSINGAFSLAYKANIESVQTQAGVMHGKMTVGESIINIDGKIEPLEFAGWLVPGVVPLFRLTISGQWSFTKGEQGNGDFTAYAVFIPTPEGHVYLIVDSAFVMTGK